MTMNKFIVHEIDEFDSYIEIDGVQCYMDTVTAYNIAEKLNELHNKNIQLEQFKEYVFEDIDRQMITSDEEDYDPDIMHLINWHLGVVKSRLKRWWR